MMGSEEVLSTKRIDGVEIDILISKYNLGIEYVGSSVYYNRDGT